MGGPAFPKGGIDPDTLQQPLLTLALALAVCRFEITEELAAQLPKHPIRFRIPLVGRRRSEFKRCAGQQLPRVCVVEDGGRLHTRKGA